MTVAVRAEPGAGQCEQPHASGDADPSAAGRCATEIELFSLAGNDGFLREVNVAFAQLLGLGVDEIDGRSLLELVHPDDVPQIVAALGALEAGTPEVLLETRFPRRGGGPVHLQWVARPMPGTDLWWAAGRDTTAFHDALATSEDLRARLDLAIGDVGAGMWDLDLRAGRFSWEPEACAVLGVSPGGAPASPGELELLVHQDDRSAVRAAFDAFGNDAAVQVVVVRIGTGASMRHLAVRGKILTRDRRGKPQHAVGLVLDVTAEKAMEEQMLRMAMSDALTGINNRRAFDQVLRAELRRCTRAALPFSVLMVDIDNFKRFNDTYGHLVGDDALCAVARALTSEITDGNVLARFGGEEFAVVLPEVEREPAGALAQRLVAAVAGCHLRQAPEWQLTVSVGSATWLPGDSVVKWAELLGRADAALYAAKAGGRNRACSDAPSPEAPLSPG